VIAYALLSPSPASAKGFVLVTWGDTISHLGDVSVPNRAGLAANKVGFKSSYFGVFWVDLWTWGGEFCVYEGNRYGPISRAEAARLVGKPENEVGKPFLYRFPLGWLIFGPLIALGVVVAVLDKRKASGIAALFEDARYQKALAILNERYEKQPVQSADTQAAEREPGHDERFRAAFDAAVQHLVDEGVSRGEAERNLALMFEALSQAPRPMPVPEFRLACECGKEVVVAEGAAGSSLTCECGRTIRVPSSDKLRALSG